MRTIAGYPGRLAAAIAATRRTQTIVDPHSKLMAPLPDLHGPIPSAEMCLFHEHWMPPKSTLRGAYWPLSRFAV